MTCPKCKQPSLTAEATMARVENRTDAACLSTPAYRCIICGYWQAADMPPAMPLTPEMLFKANYRQPEVKDRTTEILQPFLSTIKELRQCKRPATWDSIATLIRQNTGTRIKAKTITRYYHLQITEAA